MKRILTSMFGAALACAGSAFGADAARPVSFYNDIRPIFASNCVSCHSPEKKKGGLDLTTFKGTMAGGKEGLVVMGSKPEMSQIVKAVSGPDPSMPEKGEKLGAAQVELIARWIKEGAKDDSPAVVEVPPGMPEPGPTPLTKPPVYKALPAISAIGYSPDGQYLAVSGYYEVILHKPDGSGIAARLVGGAPRIESFTFSADSKLLAVSGGSPALFGNIQVWNLASKKLDKNFKYGRDTLYGVSFSPSADKMAYGCTDKTAHIIQTSDGKELMKLDQHSDWCLATGWTMDGNRLITGGRDMAIKMIDVKLGQFIDDINNPLEPVLCMVRHPKQDLALYGGGLGTPRIYKISDNQGRTAGRNDTNIVTTFERQPSAVHACAYSADGSKVVVGSLGEARVYMATGGNRIATLSGHDGAVFAVAFSPDGKIVATGGYDGMVRIFDAAKGTLVKAFAPVMVEK